MSEQSQPARLRRTLLGAIGTIAPGTLSRIARLTEAEAAALALRQTGRCPAPARDGRVSFAIPLVGKHQVSDWAVVQEMLAATLSALLAQTDPRWEAVICGQDRPDMPTDPRIRFLPFPDRPQSHDKVPKLRALARDIFAAKPPGFYMPLDGDDLLSHRFVDRCFADAGTGILVSEGYILDLASGKVAPTMRRSIARPTQKPFWKFCGSCFVMPTGRDPDRERCFAEGLALHEHRLYPYLARLAGIRLSEPPEPLVLYRINHGENFETRRGRGGFKTRFVSRHALDPEVAQDLLKERFGLSRR